MNAVYSSSDIRGGLDRVIIQLSISDRQSSDCLALGDLGMSLYEMSICSCDVEGLSVTSATNIASDVERFGGQSALLMICINPYRLSIQSSKSSSRSGLSPGCGRHCDIPSGPCIVPGTCTRTKWNVRMA